MASTITDEGLFRVISRAAGTVNLESVVIKAMLLNTAFASDFTLAQMKAVRFASEINSYECSGVGYVPGFGGSGRQTVAGKAVSKDTVNHLVKYTNGAVTFPGYGADAVGFIALVVVGTNDADSPVLFLIDNADVAQTGSDLRWTPPAGGVCSFALAA